MSAVALPEPGQPPIDAAWLAALQRMCMDLPIAMAGEMGDLMVAAIAPPTAEGDETVLGAAPQPDASPDPHREDLPSHDLPDIESCFA
ncbi:hypothetical protein [Methylobacterium nodulans]|uniref:Uncharacterized protein n=1 Tax=Methylobacterium nodulans (strain LMG 21967 / CNCM I-2342 / ORS 2060) TaxID=460265 RepID=B8IC78_METNO|nr:hypothetical protein [Methylobacterium nodulans]ACL55466.1 hypothetical protein Mnod_0424 [Methylobacterium nodulans ORS 2060]